MRTTTATTLTAAPPALAAALRTHAEGHLLDVDPAAEVFVTVSVDSKRRLLSRTERRVTTLAALIGRELVIVVEGDGAGPGVLAAPVADLDLGNRLHELAAQRGLDVPQDGLSLTGFATSGPDGSARSTYFLGLGDPDGARAREAITAAVRDAHRA